MLQRINTSLKKCTDALPPPELATLHQATSDICPPRNPWCTAPTMPFAHSFSLRRGSKLATQKPETNGMRLVRPVGSGRRQGKMSSWGSPGLLGEKEISTILHRINPAANCSAVLDQRKHCHVCRRPYLFAGAVPLCVCSTSPKLTGKNHQNQYDSFRLSRQYGNGYSPFFNRSIVYDGIELDDVPF